ncbi:hypothetical protein NFC81_09050 [Salinispirillum sp. LH 10-3-1]|uniref:Uncharacterized protein n=1 Tax=Salinispirillum sp. LH 10-3-1 TaxID=2952525 RepID=A0AB38YCI9_9GAMM
MSGKDDKIKETAEEKELAQIAKEKWEFSKEHLNPLMDRYMEKTDAMKSDAAYGYTRGRVNESSQIHQASERQQVEGQLVQAGLDPSSGRSTMTRNELGILHADSAGETAGRAQMEQTNQHVKGNQTITALGMGQSAQAQAGLGQIASIATNDAINSTMNNFNRKSSNMQLVGNLAGAASYGLMNRNSDPNQMQVSQEEGFRPGNVAGLAGR